jgi:hypothetical protein
MDDRDARERQWLEQEVRSSAALTDADRIRILRDLLRTAEAFLRAKTREELERQEEVRRILDEMPGRRRYEALAERLGRESRPGAAQVRCPRPADRRELPRVGAPDPGLRVERRLPAASYFSFSRRARSRVATYSSKAAAFRGSAESPSFRQ